MRKSKISSKQVNSVTEASSSGAGTIRSRLLQWCTGRSRTGGGPGKLSKAPEACSLCQPGWRGLDWPEAMVAKPRHTYKSPWGAWCGSLCEGHGGSSASSTREQWYPSGRKLCPLYSPEQMWQPRQSSYKNMQPPRSQAAVCARAFH